MIERRLRSIVRWNAIATVVRATRCPRGSAATSRATVVRDAVRGRVQPFLARPERDRRRRPRTTSRATPPRATTRALIVEGRLCEDQLPRFRQEVGGGLSSDPHPRLMPDFWPLPTVSLGIGPITSDLSVPVRQIPAGARDSRDRRGQGVGVPRRRGDGRAGVYGRDRAWGPRAARQP